MNKVILHGRLARDVEVRYTQSGKAVTSFTVAVNGVGENAKTDFIPCIAWEKTAENISKFFSKGKEILIEDGRLQTRSFEKDGVKRYVTEVVVNRFEFCGSKSADSGSTAQDNPGGFEGKPVSDEDIPF
jgi:single-strand DNA-binding protein